MDVAAPPAGALPPQAVCRGCYYPLRGLAHDRCPECGRAFDAANRKSYYRDAGTPLTRLKRACVRLGGRVLPPVLALGACLAVCWLLHVTQQFSILFWLPGLYLLWKGRWGGLVLFALLTPLSVELFIAARDYVTGSSRYVYARGMYPWTPQGSVDRATRIRGNDPGCGTRAPNEWVRSSAGRLAGSVMSRLVGPPGGAYTGPYPTEREALAAVASGGVALPPAALEGEQLSVSGVMIPISGYWFHSHHKLRRPEEPFDPTVDLTPRAALFQQRCLIVRVPCDMPAGQAHADVYLIDVLRAELFAMFGDTTPTRLVPPSSK